MFVIKDKDTDLYVSPKPYGLTFLKHSLLFKSREEAELLMPNIINSLAWRYLEIRYGKDRWHIDVDFKEFSDAVKLYSKMEIVEVDINESS